MAAPLTVNGQKTISILWRERILKREFDVVLGKMLQPAQDREAPPSRAWSFTSA
jgi:hypothetical protein